MLLKFLKNYKQTIALILLNIFVYFILIQLDSKYFYYLSAWKFDSGLFSPHQLITYQFLHANISHLYFNLWFLGYFASSLESKFRSKLFYYFIFFGIFAGFTHLILSSCQLPLVGASGSVLGIAVLSALVSKSPITKFIVSIFVIADIFNIIFPGSDNTAHWAHLGGALAGFLVFKLNNGFKK
jgi:membrane associated rhomboid family serine protease